MKCDCAHEGFRTIGSAYDHRRSVLVYYWTCEQCGLRLGEVRREQYRPQFDPRGNDGYLTPSR